MLRRSSLLSGETQLRHRLNELFLAFFSPLAPCWVTTVGNFFTSCQELGRAGSSRPALYFWTMSAWSSVTKPNFTVRLKTSAGRALSP